MGEWADYEMDKALRQEADYLEIECISDSEIVERLYDAQDEDGDPIPYSEMINSICLFYKNRGFITKKQRAVLNDALYKLG